MMKKQKFIDIGANLCDAMFRGVYHGKTYHDGDLNEVLQRCTKVGLSHVILTSTNLEDCKMNEKLIKEYESKEPKLVQSVGVHPTRCGEFIKYEKGEDAYFDELVELGKKGKEEGFVVCVGEIGLDYDRLEFCEKDVQKKYFEKQLELAEKLALPVFFHNRNSTKDFVEIVSKHKDKFIKGVVHSFDGSIEELKMILSNDQLYVGINGCSLKTNENIEMVKHIPSDRLLIETDAPWCDIRPSHESSKYVSKDDLKMFKQNKNKNHKPNEEHCVKGRNEPCSIVNVFKVVANCRNEKNMDEFANQIYQNTLDLFFPQEKH